MSQAFRIRLSVVTLSIAAISSAQATERGREVPEDLSKSRTPIKHLIVVIGENHTFDNLFGGYKPGTGQQVYNLLSQGIINEDGTPGPNFAKAVQRQAGNTSVYRVDPVSTGQYVTLPQPQTTYATGLPPGVPDVRFPSDLPPGPFPNHAIRALQRLRWRPAAPLLPDVAAGRPRQDGPFPLGGREHRHRSGQQLQSGLV
jgi:hypothetical protein